MKAQSSFLQESLFLVESLRDHVNRSNIEDESVGYAFRLAKSERTLPSVQAKIPPPLQRTHIQSPPAVTQPLQIQEAMNATPPPASTPKIQPANPPQCSSSQPAKKRPPPKPQTPFKPSPAPLVEANSSLTPQAISLQPREIPIEAIKKSIAKHFPQQQGLCHVVTPAQSLYLSETLSEEITCLIAIPRSASELAFILAENIAQVLNKISVPSRIILTEQLGQLAKAANLTTQLKTIISPKNHQIPSIDHLEVIEIPSFEDLLNQPEQKQLLWNSLFKLYFTNTQSTKV